MDRANPQETLTDGEAGWLAGIIEGDGYITMGMQLAAKKKKDRGLCVIPRIGVVNQDALIIERVREHFQRLCVDGIYVAEHGPTVHSYANSKGILTVSTSRLFGCVRILTTILPHLAGQKAARARLLLDFVERRSAHKYAPYTPEEVAVVRRFFAEHVAAKGPRRNGKTMQRFLNDWTPDTPRPRDEQGCFAASA